MTAEQRPSAELQPKGRGRLRWLYDRYIECTSTQTRWGFSGLVVGFGLGIIASPEWISWTTIMGGVAGSVSGLAKERAIRNNLTRF